MDRKGKKGNAVKTKGKPTKKGPGPTPGRSDSEESKGSQENFDSETEHAFGNDREKDEVNLLGGDDDLPTKKNK